jgi:hypothetical protein
MMKLSASEVQQASMNWKDEIGSLEGLFEFVGLTQDNETQQNEYGQFELDDEVVHKIKLLAGPHYKTIIKMYLIQKEAAENDTPLCNK